MSASSTPTASPLAFSPSARLAATVDLPTPPLPEATAMMAPTPGIAPRWVARHSGVRRRRAPAARCCGLRRRVGPAVRSVRSAPRSPRARRAAPRPLSRPPCATARAAGRARARPRSRRRHCRRGSTMPDTMPSATMSAPLSGSATVASASRICFSVTGISFLDPAGESSKARPFARACEAPGCHKTRNEPRTVHAMTGCFLGAAPRAAPDAGNLGPPALLDNTRARPLSGR